MIPGTGYVGVGTVKGDPTPVKDFCVEVEGRAIPILEAPLTAMHMDDNADNPDLCEYLVAVEWIAAVPREQAYWEKGLFANQVPVCRLRNRFTIERLTQHFNLDE